MSVSDVSAVQFGCLICSILDTVHQSYLSRCVRIPVVIVGRKSANLRR